MNAFAAMHATLKVSHVSGSRCSQVRKEKRWTWCLDLTGECAAQSRRRRRRSRRKGEAGGTERGRWQTLRWERRMMRKRRMSRQFGIRARCKYRDGNEEGRSAAGRVKMKKSELVMRQKTNSSL